MSQFTSKATQRPMSGKKRIASQYGSQTKKKPRTRKTMNRLRYGSQQAVNLLNKNLFGNQFSCRMIYAERNFALNPGIGGPAASHIFRANSIFDPDETGIGHQPTGFDQLMEFFQFYTVTAAKIFVDGNNTDGGRQYFGVYVSDSNVAATDFRQIIENGKGTYTVLNQSGVDGDSCALDVGVNIAAYSGHPSLLSDNEMRGTVASNPSNQISFIVWAAPDSARDSGAVNFQVRIEYMVVLTEPRPAPIS